jgi:hypothetical protein
LKIEAARRDTSVREIVRALIVQHFDSGARPAESPTREPAK